MTGTSETEGEAQSQMAKGYEPTPAPVMLAGGVEVGERGACHITLCLHGVHRVLSHRLHQFGRHLSFSDRRKCQVMGSQSPIVEGSPALIGEASSLSSRSVTVSPTTQKSSALLLAQDGGEVPVVDLTPEPLDGVRYQRLPVSPYEGLGDAPPRGDGYTPFLLLESTGPIATGS